MSDLTDDQKAAVAALDAAVTQGLAAFGVPGVATGYVLAVATTRYDDGGDPETSVTYFAPDGQNWITTLGVLEALRLRVRDDYLGGPGE